MSINSDFSPEDYVEFAIYVDGEYATNLYIHKLSEITVAALSSNPKIVLVNSGE